MFDPRLKHSRVDLETELAFRLMGRRSAYLILSSLIGVGSKKQMINRLEVNLILELNHFKGDQSQF